MASELASYFVSIVPSARGLTKSIAKEFSGIDAEADKAGKSSGSRFSGAFKGAMAGVAGAFAAAGIGAFISSAVDGAGRLEQSVGAIETVFRDSAGQMKAWSKDAATNVGLTSNEFNELGTLIGAQLKNGGTAMDQLAPKTNSLIGLGADLSSMFGGSAKEAVEALSSALKGERDPIERYGVSLTQAKIDAEAAALGFEKVGGALSSEATQAATLSLITKQTADAHGNFAKESDTFAHKQQVMSANWEDLKVKIGEQFMPILSGLFGFINDTALPGLANFRDGLADVGQWVKDNAVWIVPLTAAVAGYAAAMGTLSIVDTVRKFLTMAAAAQWGLNAAMAANPVGLIVAGIALIVAGLVWFFTQTELGQQIVQNVWGAIQAAVSAVVEWFQKTAMPVIEQVFAVVGAVFTWLYENVIRPVFEGISTVVGAWWDVTSYIFQILQATIEKVIAPAFVWLYENVIKPVFGYIGSLISTWWTVIVKPIFDAVAWFVNNILGPTFTWLYQTVIKPAFDGIGSAISVVWTNVVKPVFDALSGFITKTIPKAFEDGVGFIKTAWDKLQDIAKAPVKFVVNTVINDGLINGLNGIGGALGLKPLNRVALPPGFADGGYTGRGGKYQPAGIVHAGEIVWSQDDISRWGGVGVVEAMRKAVGYAKGGLVRPIGNATISQPFHGGHNGIDFAAPTGSPVVAAGPGRVSSAGWSSYGGGNEIHIDHPNGLQTWYAHLSSFAAKMGQMVTAGTKIGEVGSTGNSTGPHLHYMVLNGGWPNYKNPAEYLDGGGESGSGGGWNPIAALVDLLVDQFKKAFPQGGPFPDIAIGAGKKILNGAVDFVTGQGGKDNIGSTRLPYLHDQGGVLPPGLSQVVNRTRKPEYILNPQQWADMHSLATQAGAMPSSVNVFIGNEQLDTRMYRVADSAISATDAKSSYMRVGR